jgi:Domain of unknown function (DUF5658)
MVPPCPPEAGQLVGRPPIASRGVGPTARAARVLDVAVMFAIASSLLDVVTTWYALDPGGHVEQNPVMRVLMEEFGLWPLLLVNLVVRLAIVCSLVLIARRSSRSVVRRTASGVLIAATVWWCVVVFANCVTIGRTMGHG